jgi:hypothetical protein
MLKFILNCGGDLDLIGWLRRGKNRAFVTVVMNYQVA